VNKEQVYDEQIAPLMDQVIAICRDRKIAMLATFAIPTEEDNDLSCTTHLPDESGKLPEQIERAARIVRGTPSPLMLTTRNAAGEVTQITAVLP
jgi:hypothetical protein